MEIKVKTEGITKTKTDRGYTLDFGNISRKSKAIIDVNISGVENLALASTCGCTVAQTDESGNTEIEYTRTAQQGTFAKTITATYKQNGKEQKSEIKIKGNVN